MKHDPLVTHLRDMCDRGAYQAACMAADPAAILIDRNRLAEENERLREAIRNSLAWYDALPLHARQNQPRWIGTLRSALAGRDSKG